MADKENSTYKTAVQMIEDIFEKDARSMYIVMTYTENKKEETIDGHVVSKANGLTKEEIIEGIVSLLESNGITRNLLIQHLAASIDDPISEVTQMKRLI